MDVSRAFAASPGQDQGKTRASGSGAKYHYSAHRAFKKGMAPTEALSATPLSPLLPPPPLVPIGDRSPRREPPVPPIEARNSPPLGSPNAKRRC
jgi:hypothetical protein